MGIRTFAIGALCLASSVVARTDLVGCTYFDTVSAYPGGQPFATRIWYVPGSGELCDFLDCGGGRAPPKTTVPGCAAYEGTETYSPSFINPKTLGHAPATNSPAKTTASESAAGTTASGSSDVATTATTPVVTKAPESSVSGSNTAQVTATPSGSGVSGTNSTKPTSSSSTGGAALPTAGAMLGSWMMAGVAAGLGLF
ncbi:siderophore biosynthesis enzyme [Pochonia chlamydosporia 170]|uniref:Siderophore biosynthesis enzyme n=1 Tax=Pochonia chlamydosporia 170 TaxID=1380566 RepID=A0A179G990_METCM|nr:siderophore biosynthesis enzyme [Pochonia chlamydosporia 170]OAQ74060.1 siderophore biosynthesis enzyme [Pochonia chlamydosporia 170]